MSEKVKGNGDAAGSILSILEVSLEDFTRLLAETESVEADAVKAFEALSQENKVSKAAKGQEIVITSWCVVGCHCRAGLVPGTQPKVNLGDGGHDVPRGGTGFCPGIEGTEGMTIEGWDRFLSRSL